MQVRRKPHRRTVRVLRKVVKSAHPKRLNLSPLTAVEVLSSADPKEVEIVEMEDEMNGERVKHISFRGVPIYLSVKLSHHMQNMALV